jgi:adenylate cyclase
MDCFLAETFRSEYWDRKQRSPVALEIERKFIATNAVLVLCRVGIPIVQGYLYTDATNTIRVRRAGGQAFMAWKGKREGCSRHEHEHEICPRRADLTLAGLQPDQRIEKTRYLVEHAGAIWEVDVFAGALSGLILAEIELAHEGELVILPSWIVREVTLDERYRNSRLASQAAIPRQSAA